MGIFANKGNYTSTGKGIRGSDSFQQFDNYQFMLNRREEEDQKRKQIEASKSFIQKINWGEVLFGNKNKRQQISGNPVEQGVKFVDRAGRGDYGIVGTLGTFPVSGVMGFLNTGNEALKHYLAQTVNQKQVTKSGDQQRENLKNLRQKGLMDQATYAQELGKVQQWEKDEMDRVYKKMNIKKEDLTNDRFTGKRIAGDAGMAAIDMATLGLGSAVLKGTKYGTSSAAASFKYISPKAVKALQSADKTAEVIKVLSKQGLKNAAKMGAKGAGLGALNTISYGMSENKSTKDIAKDLPLGTGLGFALGGASEGIGQVLRNRGAVKALESQKYLTDIKNLSTQRKQSAKVIADSQKAIDEQQKKLEVARKRTAEIADTLKKKNEGKINLTPSQELKLRDEARTLIASQRAISKESNKFQKVIDTTNQSISEAESKIALSSGRQSTGTPVLDALREGLKKNPDSKILKWAEQRVAKPRWYRETLTNIKKLSPETAQIIEKQAITEGMYKGEGELIISAITNKAKKDPQLWAKIANEIRTKERGKLTGYSKMVANLLDKRVKQLRDAGVDVGQIERYFPKLIDPTQRRALQQELTALGYGKESKIAKTLFERGLRPSKADLEYGRIFDKLPKEVQEKIKKYYVEDPASILANWNKETSGRLAEAQYSGADLKKLETSYGAAGQDAAKYIQDSYNLWRFGREKTNVEQTIKGIEVFTKMGMSTLSNLSQHTNTATVCGLKITAKAAKEAALNPKAAEKLALKSGVNVHEITDELTQALYEAQRKNPAVSAAELLLKINQFKAVEKGNRLVASVAGRDYIKKLALDPEKNWAKLEEIGLNPAKIASVGLKQDDIYRGIYNVVGKTQFYTDAMTLPRWTVKSGFGEVASTLTKFSMKQTKFLKDQIVKQAVNGNPGPLIRYLMVGSLFGELTNDARNAITGKERKYTMKDVADGIKQGDWNPFLYRMLAENVARAGGYGLVYDMAQSAEYQDTTIGKMAVVGGPVASDIMDVVKTVDTFANKGTDAGIETLTKQGIKRVPFLKAGLTKFADPASGTAWSDRKSEKLIPNAKNPVTKGINASSATYTPQTFEAGTSRDAILKSLSRDAQTAYPTLRDTYEGETPLLASARKASVYIDFPELFYLDKKYKQDNKKNTGQDYDPIYDLPYSQAKQVYYQIAKGDKFNQAELYKNSWYSAFKEKQSAYYEKVKQDRGNEDYAGAEATKYYVEPSAQVKYDQSMGRYTDASKEYTEATRAANDQKRADLGAITPELYNMIKTNTSAGMEALKNNDQKTLWYMQALRQAGIPGAFDSFFEKNPQLDPKSEQFTGKFAGSGSSYGSYSSKPKVSKIAKSRVKKLSATKIKQFQLKKSKVKLTEKLATKYK